MNLFFYLLLICNLHIVSALAQTSPVQILENKKLQFLSVSSESPQVALLVFPGAFVEPHAYLDLASKIVTYSEGNIAVIIPKFFAGYPNPLQAESKLKIAMQFLEQKGLQDIKQRIFVMGHSEGGIYANSLPYNHDLGGLILLGSYLPHLPLFGKNLATYPRPVLTLGAELDGLTGLNYLAREAQTTQKLATNDSSVILDKLVVVMRGASHMQFADGRQMKGDGAAEKPIEVIHNLAAQTITDFVAVHSQKVNLDAVVATTRLQSQFTETLDLIQPYLVAKNQEAEVCARLQKLSTPLSSASWDPIRIHSKIYRSHWTAAHFILDSSSIRPGDQGYDLHLPVYLEFVPNLLDVSQDQYLSPEVIACKLVGAETIVKATGLELSQDSTTCSEFNAITLRETLALIQDRTQIERLEKLYGTFDTWTMESSQQDNINSVRYGPFLIRSREESTDQAWLKGSFQLRKQNQSWELKTVETRSKKSTTDQSASGSGITACKVIAPERVIEWATVLGLK